VEQLVDRTERELGSARVPLARRLRVFDLIRLVAHTAGPHHLPAFAGNLAYNAFLAIVPFLLFLVSVLRAVHATSLLSGLVDVVSATLPASSAHVLRDQVQAEVTSRIPDVWLLSVLLAAGALWACSAAFRAVAAAMNVIYETRDDRPLLAQLALSVVLSLATAVLFLVALVLVEATSHALGEVVDAPFYLIWNPVKWTVLMASAFVGFAATYAFVPRVKRPIRAVIPGAAFATCASVLFSLGFAFVFNVFGSVLVDPLYGWFTGLFALLLYLYWASFILLVGAEVNHAIEAHGGPADSERPEYARPPVPSTTAQRE
jgi:membrane protein